MVLSSLDSPHWIPVVDTGTCSDRTLDKANKILRKLFFVLWKHFQKPFSFNLIFIKIWQICNTVQNWWQLFSYTVSKDIFIIFCVQFMVIDGNSNYFFCFYPSVCYSRDCKWQFKLFVRYFNVMLNFRGLPSDSVSLCYSWLFQLWPVWADDEYLVGFVKFMQASCHSSSQHTTWINW